MREPGEAGTFRVLHIKENLKMGYELFGGNLPAATPYCSGFFIAFPASVLWGCKYRQLGWGAHSAWLVLLR